MSAITFSALNLLSVPKQAKQLQIGWAFHIEAVPYKHRHILRLGGYGTYFNGTETATKNLGHVHLMVKQIPYNNLFPCHNLHDAQLLQ